MNRMRSKSSSISPGWALCKGLEKMCTSPEIQFKRYELKNTLHWSQSMKWTRPQNRDKSYLHYHCTEPPLNNEKTREVSTVQCSIYVEFSELVQLIVDCRQHFYLCSKKPQIRYSGLCWRPISRRISFVIWYEDLDLTADLGRAEWAFRMYKSSLHIQGHVT